MVVVELNIVPLGEGVSVSKRLAYAIKALEKKGVKYTLTPMCTVFEVETVREAFETALAAHQAVLESGAKRVITTVKVDDRRDIKRSMEEKIRSLEKAVETIR